MSFREINFSVIGRYVDYLVEKQGVKNIFGKSSLAISLHNSSSVLSNRPLVNSQDVTMSLCHRFWPHLAKRCQICEFADLSGLDLKSTSRDYLIWWCAFKADKALFLTPIWRRKFMVQICYLGCSSLFSQKVVEEQQNTGLSLSRGFIPSSPGPLIF